MELKLLHIILALFVVTRVASEAAYAPEEYWKSKLPNTPIPQAIWDIVHVSDLVEDKPASVDVSKGGVHVNTKKGKYGDKKTSVRVGKGGINLKTGSKDKPVYVSAAAVSKAYIYASHATEAQIQTDANLATFFLEKDLIKGKTMTLYFPSCLNKSRNLYPSRQRTFPRL